MYLCMSRLSSHQAPPLHFAQFLRSHPACAYMRLSPSLTLLRFIQRTSPQTRRYNPCHYHPLRSVTDVIPGYCKSFSCSNSTSSHRMSRSVGIITSLYNASVTTPKNLSGSPEDVVNKSHHLKCGNGFANPWPRYIYIFLPSSHISVSFHITILRL